MNSKQRFITAIEGGIPDRIPTFELEFQLEEEMFGKTFDYSKTENRALDFCSAGEREYRLSKRAEHIIYLYMHQLEYDCIPTNNPHTIDNFDYFLEYVRILRRMVGDTVCLHSTDCDGTMCLPDGKEMYSFAYRTADDYGGLLSEAEKMASDAIEHNRRLADAGIDVFCLCSDYCFNSGPYISPKMFSELITPNLTAIIADIRNMGLYAIKHTDGNIMPVIDQLVFAKPHALHSLDPMAGVDIKEVKEKYGKRVALCGNVNCALMQTGSDDEVIESAMYCLRYGKPDGGYVFCTSNVPFKGLPPERYRLILDIWKKHREYRFPQRS